MIKTLIKSTIDVRVETKEDVGKLHDEITQKAKEYGATLTSWKENRRDIKEKKEVVATYYVVSYTIVFEDDIKEPTSPLFMEESYKFQEV